MTEEDVRKIVELCAEVCDSRSRSLSRDNSHMAANEAQKCAGSVRARVGSIINQMFSDPTCWYCKGESYGSYCTVCKKKSVLGSYV